MATGATCRRFSTRADRPQAFSPSGPAGYTPPVDLGREHRVELEPYSGPLDLLGTIGAGRGYEDLLPHSDEIEIGHLRLRVLSLEKLIEVKEEMGFEKDKAILPILRQTLLEKRKHRKPDD